MSTYTDYIYDYELFLIIGILYIPNKSFLKPAQRIEDDRAISVDELVFVLEIKVIIRG